MMKEGIVAFAERIVRENKTTWHTLYSGNDSVAVETLMRSGHIARFFPDFEGHGNIKHMEALATIASVYD